MDRLGAERRSERGKEGQRKIAGRKFLEVRLNLQRPDAGQVVHAEEFQTIHANTAAGQ